MEQEINLQEEITNAKIRQYAKEHPDWLFVKQEKGWVVKIKGETHYIETADEHEAESIKERTGVDIQGEMYIHVSNFYPSGEKTFHTFVGRPGDAIQAIRDGQADVFRMTNLFGGMTESALYFFNREVGEKLRQIAVEGFKGVQFKYIVALYVSQGFGYTYLMGEDKKTALSQWDYDKKPYYFDTEEEATFACTELERVVKELTDSFDSKDTFLNYLREHFNDCTLLLQAINAEGGLKFQTLNDENDKRVTACRFEVQQRMIIE